MSHPQNPDDPYGYGLPPESVSDRYGPAAHRAATRRPKKPKKRNTGLYLFGGPIALLIGIGLVIGIGEAPASAAPSGTGIAATGVPAAGQTVDIDGLELTAGPIRPVARQPGGKVLCTTVTYVNTTGDTITGSPLDWRLQNPDGATETMTLGVGGDMGRTFTGADVASGATVTGTMCFRDLGAAGEYRILFDSTFESGLGAVAWTAR